MNESQRVYTIPTVLSAKPDGNEEKAAAECNILF